MFIIKKIFYITILTFACIFVFPIFLSSSSNQYFSHPDKCRKYYDIAVARSVYSEIESKLIYEDDYTWEYTFKETGKLFQKIYNSGKRLPDPVYYNREKERFMLPVDEYTEMEIKWDFIYSITKHIEESIENQMADYIFLPDMGHGHFFLRKNSRVFQYPADESYDRLVFEEILNSGQTIILYHTVEMFLFFGKKQDFDKLPAHEKYRNRTRNLSGSFIPADKMTMFIPFKFGNPVVNNFDSRYRKVAQDIDISASKYGQFPYEHNGKILYFDISRFSPGLNPDII